MSKSRLSAVVFGLTLLFFLMPWVSVGCGDVKVVELSGMEIMFGFEIPPQFADYRGERGSLDTAIYAQIAATLSIIGAILSFASREKEGNGIKYARAGVAGLGFLTLLVLKFATEDLIDGRLADSEFAYLIQVDWGIGYWLALLVFLGIAALQFMPIRTTLGHKSETMSDFEDTRSQSSEE